MNDQQFEESLQVLEQAMWPSTAEKLRSRDTAQREALARLEAERDTAIAQMQNIRKNRDRLNKEQCDTEFKLCIAKQQLAEAVGLLKKLRPWMTRLAERNGDGDLAEAALLDDFLARHAQAEQQKAKPATFYDAIKNPPRIAPTLQLQAKGEPAGEFKREDRYIVIKRKDLVALHRDAFGPTQVAIEAFYAAIRMIEVQLPRRDYLVIERDWPEYEPTWAAIQARVEGRAALATQPAAGEPVRVVVEPGEELSPSNQVGNRIDRMLTIGTRLYTALPAAMHGDEAVAVVGTVPDGSGFKSLDFKVDLQDLPDGTRLYAMGPEGAPT